MILTEFSRLDAAGHGIGQLVFRLSPPCSLSVPCIIRNVEQWHTYKSPSNPILLLGIDGTL